MNIENKGEVVLYNVDETISIEVNLKRETVWLTQQQIADLFGTKRPAITKHLNNIYQSGELDKISTCSILEHMGNDGKQHYTTTYYNLDVIISVGYRVNSINATSFRRWATNVLRAYLLKGYSVNHQLIALQERTDERLMNLQQQLNEQRDKVDFLVNIHRQPEQSLFATGCMWDAYAYMASIIRSAKRQVILIDNYCNDKTLTLLDQRNEGVSCTIYTTFNKIIEDALDQHNAQFAPICRVQLPHKIHDRFLIIDQQVYLLGNSLKDMGHTLSAAILTGFTPEDVLSKLT